MNRPIKWFLGAALILVLLVSACGPQAVEPAQPSPEATPYEEKPLPGENNQQGEQPVSAIEREIAPDVPESDLRALSAGNNAFALSLYKQLRGQEAGNLFYSPYSISLALAMTYAGARGETERQMAETLHFDLEQEKLHQAFNALDQMLRPENTNEDSSFRLNIANSLWGQQGYPFLEEFLSTLARNYGAGMNLVDYSDPEKVREMINAWVEAETEEKIQDLIPEGALDVLTRLVLVNAIYFNANWAFPFDATSTKSDRFTLLDGSTVEVEMMNQRANLNYIQAESFQALELPYMDSSMAMYILLPDAGNFEAFEQALDVDLLQEVREGLQWTSVELSLPKFNLESAFGLSETLQAMGMVDAFDPDLADFTGMTPERELYITDVIHKAYVNVDEEGTEAAAATGVVVGIVSMPANEAVVKVDRPFVFLIVDRNSETILFVGRVIDPR